LSAQGKMLRDAVHSVKAFFGMSTSPLLYHLL
jgi:hypothetical protein